jgi:endonuclease V-like protein UPF0215 family
MAERRFSHVIGIDDAPFRREHRGDVLVVGVVFAGARPDGVLSTRVRRDGANATDAIAAMVRGSQFFAHLHAILLQGIALAGFNVVDIHRLHDDLGKPVLVVARRAPDFEAIRSALLSRVRGGATKWRLVERAGPMEPVGRVHVQRAGIDIAAAEALVRRLSTHGNIPEPLRLAHLIAGGVTTGRSRGRA